MESRPDTPDRPFPLLPEERGQRRSEERLFPRRCTVGCDQLWTPLLALIRQPSVIRINAWPGPAHPVLHTVTQDPISMPNQFTSIINKAATSSPPTSFSFHHGSYQDDSEAVRPCDDLDAIPSPARTRVANVERCPPGCACRPACGRGRQLGGVAGKNG